MPVTMAIFIVRNKLKIEKKYTNNKTIYKQQIKTKFIKGF